MPMLEDQSCLSPPSDLTKYVGLQPFHLCDCNRTTVLKQAQIISPLENTIHGSLKSWKCVKDKEEDQVITQSEGMLLKMRTAGRMIGPYERQSSIKPIIRYYRIFVNFMHI